MAVMDADSHDSLPPHARRLRAARKARGWSLADAAEQTGFAKSSWQGWEQGVFPPTDRALAIAGSLGVKVEDIWGDGPFAPSEAAETVIVYDNPEDAPHRAAV